MYDITGPAHQNVATLATFPQERVLTPRAKMLHIARNFRVLPDEADKLQNTGQTESPAFAHSPLIIITGQVEGIQKHRHNGRCFTEIHLSIILKIKH